MPGNGTAYKNFWSLNTDEAVVTGIVRGSSILKDLEVLMPMDAQMKDIDLVLMNLKNKKAITIQVKGSRAYEPKPSEIKKYGFGSNGWFFLNQDVVHRSQADFFIFLVYVLNEDSGNGRRVIEPHTITIPTTVLQDICKKYKKPHPDRYSFYFWVNPKENKCFDWRDQQYNIDEFLDDRGFQILKNSILGS